MKLRAVEASGFELTVKPTLTQPSHRTGCSLTLRSPSA